MVQQPAYRVEPMALSDLDEVMQIEQASFSSPWSERAYRFEITENQNSTMLVVRQAARPSAKGSLWRALLGGAAAADPRPLLGYAGCWYLVDEVHVCTIAVRPDRRRQRLGELLLISLLEQGARRGARRATLEVRVSNSPAQGLYQKYGFQVVSRRKHYYADNNEDAYLMATPLFVDRDFRSTLRSRRHELNRILDFRFWSLSQESRTQDPESAKESRLD